MRLAVKVIAGIFVLGAMCSYFIQCVMYAD